MIIKLNVNQLKVQTNVLLLLLLNTLFKIMFIKCLNFYNIFHNASSVVCTQYCCVNMVFQ